jgi:Uma2 family endonuclease
LQLGLTDYILIESESIHVEHFAIKKEGLWQLKELNNPGEEIFLETHSIKLSLEEIYEDCKL